MNVLNGERYDIEQFTSWSDVNFLGMFPSNFVETDEEDEEDVAKSKLPPPLVPSNDEGLYYIWIKYIYLYVKILVSIQQPKQK